MSYALFASIIAAVFASSGLWSLVLYYIQRRDNKKDNEEEELELQSKMLLGLGHDKIIQHGTKYIEQGYITYDDYNDLNKYLYAPYKALGGDGTAEKIMKEVEKLPIRPNNYDK